MKKFLLLFIMLGIFFVACKKDINQKKEPVPATQVELALVNNNISGTWGYIFGKVDFTNVSGIPGNSDFPLNSSVVFDGNTQLTKIDYDGNEAKQSYLLSGADNVYYVNFDNPASVSRKCRILMLTKDSLKLQNIITGQDTSKKLVFTEVFAKANESDRINKIFRISLSPFSFYILNINVDVYLTPKGGGEQLVESKSGITQPYSYSYIPSSGDHIRIALSGPNTYGFGPIAKCLATYKGIPFGKDWESAGFSSPLIKSWVIN